MSSITSSASISRARFRIREAIAGVGAPTPSETSAQALDGGDRWQEAVQEAGLSISAIEFEVMVATARRRVGGQWRLSGSELVASAWAAQELDGWAHYQYEADESQKAAAHYVALARWAGVSQEAQLKELAWLQHWYCQQQGVPQAMHRGTNTDSSSNPSASLAGLLSGTPSSTPDRRRP